MIIESTLDLLSHERTKSRHRQKTPPDHHKYTNKKSLKTTKIVYAIPWQKHPVPLLHRKRKMNETKNRLTVSNFFNCQRARRDGVDGENQCQCDDVWSNRQWKRIRLLCVQQNLCCVTRCLCQISCYRLSPGSVVCHITFHSRHAVHCHRDYKGNKFICL